MSYASLFLVNGNFTRLQGLFKCADSFCHFLQQFSQNPQMHLIKSQGLLHLQVPWMVSELILSYNRWSFIVPDLGLALCNLVSMVGILAGEDWGKKKLLSTSAFSLFWVIRSQIFFWEGLDSPWSSFYHQHIYRTFSYCPWRYRWDLILSEL